MQKKLKYFDKSICLRVSNVLWVNLTWSTCTGSWFSIFNSHFKTISWIHFFYISGIFSKSFEQWYLILPKPRFTVLTCGMIISGQFFKSYWSWGLRGMSGFFCPYLLTKGISHAAYLSCYFFCSIMAHQ